MDTQAQTIDLDNAEFQNALRLVDYTDRSVFLTGKAGTGKSTFLRYITQHTKKKFLVLAPTGIAAVNVGGQTLHSFFRIPLKPLLPDDPDFSVRRLRQRLKYSSSHVKLIRSLELIIIDEISMVRADVIDFIDKVLRVYSGNMRQPFGGKQMLFVGDVFQLEPVVNADARDVLSRAYKGFYFFDAQVFENFAVVPIELRKVYRQSDPAFIAMLDRVRMGSPNNEDLVCLNSRYSPTPDMFDTTGNITIATRRDIVDHINSSRLAQLPDEERTYRGRVNGTFPETSYPTDLELVVKVGAQVVFIKNDVERRWVNGTLGIIEQCEDDFVMVRTPDDILHKVEFEVWDNVKYVFNEEKRTVDERVQGSFVQLPIKLAWALTIHKSQGLTFDNVTIDFGRGTFTGGQAYVALSRCRSFAGISLRSTINARDIYVNQRVAQFAQRFNNPKLINEALSLTKADQLYNKAAKEWEKRDYEAAISNFCEAVSLRPDDLGHPATARLLQRKLSSISDLQTQIADLKAQLEFQTRKMATLASEFVAMGITCAEQDWDVDAAIANFDKALSLDPENFAALLAKSDVMTQVDTDEAVKLLLRAAAKEPKSPLPHQRLADVYQQLGDDMSSALHAAKALKLSKPPRKKRK